MVSSGILRCLGCRRLGNAINDVENGRLLSKHSLVRFRSSGSVEGPFGLRRFWKVLQLAVYGLRVLLTGYSVHHPRDIRLSTYLVHRLWKTCHPSEHLHFLVSFSATGIRTVFSVAEFADAYQGSARLYDHWAS